VTRYFATLIRVIVTPAIYRCFVRLNDVNRHSTEQDSRCVQIIILEWHNAAFLLNSWAPLVTIGSDFYQSQAFSRSYSSNWPNSLNYHSSMAIGYSPWRPDAVMGTNILIILIIFFSRFHYISELIIPKNYFAIYTSFFPFWQDLKDIIRCHLGKITLITVYNRRRKLSKMSPFIINYSYRISTIYPFWLIIKSLGSTNSGTI